MPILQKVDRQVFVFVVFVFVVVVVVVVVSLDKLLQTSIFRHFNGNSFYAIPCRLKCTKHVV